MNKIDFLFPIHRGEIINPYRLKKRFDFIEKLGDTDGMTYTIVSTLSQPELSYDEIRKIIPSDFYNILILNNDDYRGVSKQYNFNIDSHYYPITSVTWELIVRNYNIIKKGEAFHIFHINDMHPFHLKWAQEIYRAWCGVNKPYIYGEFWHGGVYGPGPFVDGLYNWKWSESDRKWGGWGAYDAELPYMAWNNEWSVVPSTKTVGILSHNFLRRLSPPTLNTEKLDWVDETFNTWMSIFHNFEDKMYHKERWESDHFFNYLVDFYTRKYC